MEINELWQYVLSEVELNLTKATFNTWFQHTSINSIENGVVVISVPNSFAKEWLENKFNKFILKSIRNIHPEIKEVKFLISSSSKDYITQIKKKRPQEKEFISEDSQLDFGNVDKETNLNPKYTLDDFIVGSSNELVYAAALSIIKNPGTVYNPLFIYGGSGLGKTHLLQAIGNEITRLYKDKKVKYASSEKFTIDLVAAIQHKETEKFKDSYRKNDLLIIDDVQFIAGKEKTQEELFHTFNSLYEKNKQIIMSSDRQPKAIPSLEDRLRSRFEGGMMADVGYPDYETRLAILKTKAIKKQIILSNDVFEYIASNFQKNVRELEGALNKVIIQAKILNKTINIDDVKKALLTVINPPKRNINIKQIIQVVSDFYDVNEKQLFLKTRKQEIVKPRQIIMFLLREELKFSYPQIGTKIGGRDHTTVMHACDKIEETIKKDNILADEINLIRQSLYTS